MKKGDALQLNAAWWAKNKPSALPKTGLGLALTEYDKVKMASMSSKPKETEGKKAIKALLALRKVDAARLKAISHCVGPLFYDTKAALQKTAALTAANTLYLNGLKVHVKYYEESVANLATYL